jgi:hypothetical protein
MRTLDVALYYSVSLPLPSLHYIVIIVSVQLLLPLHLPFQLIGFSYYSMLPQHCSLYSLLRTSSIFNPSGAKKRKKNRDRQEANRRRWWWKNKNRPTTSRYYSIRFVSTDDDGWLLRTTLQDVKQRYLKNPRTER